MFILYLQATRTSDQRDDDKKKEKSFKQTKTNGGRKKWKEGVKIKKKKLKLYFNSFINAFHLHSKRFYF